MKAATIHEIKKELLLIPPAQMIDLCMSLAKYKKDNKEFLSYLLFESTDNATFINSIKLEIQEQFLELNTNNLYLLKKRLRKILKNLNKYIKYINDKQTEVELLIYFCNESQKTHLPINASVALKNIYLGLIKKIKTGISKLHEDLQYDFLKEVEGWVSE